MLSGGDVKHSNEEKGKLDAKHVVTLDDIYNSINTVHVDSTLTEDILVCIECFCKMCYLFKCGCG